MGNKKKSEQLGMAHGTAANRLRKQILFSLLVILGLNFCWQCGGEIKTPEELSIEHITPWLDSKDPVGLFFDIENIAFSHLKCNVAAARKTEPWNKGKQFWKHGDSTAGYKIHGCRCDLCKEYYSKIRKAQYKRTGT